MCLCIYWKYAKHIENKSSRTEKKGASSIGSVQQMLGKASFMWVKMVFTCIGRKLWTQNKYLANQYSNQDSVISNLIVSIALYYLVQIVKRPVLRLYLPSTVTRSTQKVWELKPTTRRSLVLNRFLAGGSTSHRISDISLRITSSLTVALKFLSSVQLLSHVRIFAIPWTAARQAPLSIPNPRAD